MNNEENVNKNLIDKIKKFPLSPGCYIFKNKIGEIIYIGKSNALRSRIKQYFRNVDSKEGKYLRLSKEIFDVDIIKTETETDALILECKLIKTYKPKYNSQLKKTRTYPYIKINQKLAYPTIYLTNQVQDDNCNYFGYFYNEDDAYNTILLINRIWKTPLCCKESFEEYNKSSCLNFHLNKCCAPCDHSIGFELYIQKIKEIVKCLKGNSRSIRFRLEKEMKLFSKNLNYEKAAYIRDNLNALERLQRKLRRHNTNLDHKDVYLFLRAFKEKSFSIFFIRNGLTLKRIVFQNNEAMNREQLTTFVNDIEAEWFPSEDSKFLTTCLLEIFADKLFVDIKEKSSKEKIIRILEKEFYKYIM